MFAAKTILVPVDFSNTSQAAISVALQMADRSGARVIFLHADPTLRSGVDGASATGAAASDVADTIAQREAGIRGEVEQELERAAARGVTLRTTPHLLRVTGGDWVEVALRLIAEEEVDLVVAATHGGDRGGLLGLLQGSATERLVHRAPCSVFVVKAEGFPYLTD
ncbi:universal stress protein [Myxococcota bacterium]|nr:universal stress protein [Myxococcota bacterium]